MNAGPLTRASYGLPPGAWRWAALGFFALALAAGVLALITSHAGWAGMVLVAGIGIVAGFLFYAMWPRQTLSAMEARRVAEAAARANVAWAVTGADGAVLDCNNA